MAAAAAMAADGCSSRGSKGQQVHLIAASADVLSVVVFNKDKNQLWGCDLSSTARRENVHQARSVRLATPAILCHFQHLLLQQSNVYILY